MNRKIHRVASTLLMAVILAGCGGGGSDGGFAVPVVATTTSPPATATPPAQASALDKFLAFVKDMVASSSSSAEPADVSAFDPPPRSETAEPVAAQ
ncbi:hypothetical protein VAR608DRAFT_2966 [Variovorax sp. HW608]|uniref:hypothetical protein n=1 Tax=Variovorax sp. HW608 TaxID=1034889 RepID=UPI00081FA013|nr:hypothetical protein [Variovorax sp. HW608]SCK33486.1 hypothetical protein VAR608DRAFT_2966 [Variovorax sp. HW608]